MGRPENTHRIRNYDINFLAFLLTQVMGNGITSLDTMMGMFGLGVHSGSHREWTYIARELGKAEQKRADKIQHQNLLTEIAMTKTRRAALEAAKRMEISETNLLPTSIHDMWCSATTPPTGGSCIPNFPPFVDEVASIQNENINTQTPSTVTETGFASSVVPEIAVADVNNLVSLTLIDDILPAREETVNKECAIAREWAAATENERHAMTITTTAKSSPYVANVHTENSMQPVAASLNPIPEGMSTATEKSMLPTTIIDILQLRGGTGNEECASATERAAGIENEGRAVTTTTTTTAESSPYVANVYERNAMQPVAASLNPTPSQTPIIDIWDTREGTGNEECATARERTETEGRTVTTTTTTTAESSPYVATVHTENVAPDRPELNIMLRNQTSDGEYAMFHLEVDNMTQQEDMIELVQKYLEPLTVCYDMGWQRRSSGSAYNSMSGHAFLVGANSNKILKRIVFSKSCCTCARLDKKDPEAAAARRAAEPMGILPTEGKGHRCPRNFNGSSKSMEPQGAVALLTDLFDSGIAYGKELVVDDDCSTKANTRHSFKAKVDAKVWENKETCWPRRNGNYLIDYGKLPLRVPEVEHYLADPMHRCKSFGRELFKLVEEKGKQLRFDKIDCARLKRNFTYWLRQNCNEPFHVFVYRFACVLEHHFGIHDFCKGKKEGGWCKYKGDEEMMAKAREENRYHDKQMEAPLYAAVLAIWRRYATEEMLRQSHHPYWCQKSESLNQLVTVFAPKDKHLSASMSLSDRVSLVVIIDSVGFLQGIFEVMEEIGCKVPASTMECLKQRDAKHEYDKNYKKN